MDTENPHFASQDENEPQDDFEGDLGPIENGRGSRFDFMSMYIKEVAILVLGVLIGFFWSQYFQEVDNEAHLIVLLLLIVLCLIRLIYLLMSGRNKVS